MLFPPVLLNVRFSHFPHLPNRERDQQRERKTRQKRQLRQQHKFMEPCTEVIGMEVRSADPCGLYVEVQQRASAWGGEGRGKDAAPGGTRWKDSRPKHCILSWHHLNALPARLGEDHCHLLQTCLVRKGAWRQKGSWHGQGNREGMVAGV